MVVLQSKTDTNAHKQQKCFETRKYNLKRWSPSQDGLVSSRSQHNGWAFKSFVVTSKVAITYMSKVPNKELIYTLFKPCLNLQALSTSRERRNSF